MPVVEKRRSRLKRGVFLCLVFLFLALPARSFAAAPDIRLALSRAAGAAEKEKLYLRLIDECPETEDAEEAHWALSALYLDEFDEPKEDEARKILERFLARYPSSLWALHAENRLLWLRGVSAIRVE
ncbi:MAG: hypothetical protein LBR71_03875 [Synergistaceae bacterium]|jgi:hypothetical protein|nr:hypothetical protein [Synergistaceae bacterium]